MSVPWPLYLISSVLSNGHRQLPSVWLCLEVGMSGAELDSPLRNVALSIVREIWKLIWLIITLIPRSSLTLACHLLIQAAALAAWGASVEARKTPELEAMVA